MGADDASSDDDIVIRAHKGDNVIDSNGYFTFTRSPKFYDVKVTTLPRWAAKEGMGTSDKSKTISLTKVASTDAAVLALRAWMVGRLQQGGFHARKQNRHKFWLIEFDKLRIGLQRNTEGRLTTGCGYADELVQEWCPRALACP